MKTKRVFLFVSLALMVLGLILATSAFAQEAPQQPEAVPVTKPITVYSKTVETKTETKTEDGKTSTKTVEYGKTKEAAKHDEKMAKIAVEAEEKARKATERLLLLQMELARRQQYNYDDRRYDEYPYQERSQGYYGKVPYK